MNLNADQRTNRNAARSRPGCAAFTLPEVSMAVLVVGAVTIALFAALSSGFALCAQTRENLHAAQILTQKIEEIRLCHWNELTNQINFSERYSPSGTGAGLVYSGTISTNAADVIPDLAAYKSNMRLVTVSVSWTTYDQGRPLVHRRQMQTLVSRYGLQNYIFGK